MIVDWDAGRHNHSLRRETRPTSLMRTADRSHPAAAAWYTLISKILGTKHTLPRWNPTTLMGHLYRQRYPAVLSFDDAFVGACCPGPLQYFGSSACSSLGWLLSVSRAISSPHFIAFAAVTFMLRLFLISEIAHVTSSAEPGSS